MKLIIKDFACYYKTRKKLNLYECDCGKLLMVRGTKVKNGQKSCGCLSNKKYLKGLTKSKEYRAHVAIRQRCYNKNTIQYKWYGAKGIKVCDRWLGPEGFINFYNDMGTCPPDKWSIDRINNDGNYEPNNCRWATYKEQQNNRKSNIKITYEGLNFTMQEIHDYLGISLSTLYSRVYRSKKYSLLNVLNVKK